MKYFMCFQRSWFLCFPIECGFSNHGYGCKEKCGECANAGCYLRTGLCVYGCSDWEKTHISPICEMSKFCWISPHFGSCGFIILRWYSLDVLGAIGDGLKPKIEYTYNSVTATIKSVADKWKNWKLSFRCSVKVWE